jgi:hypothetical protein
MSMLMLINYLSAGLWSAPIWSQLAHLPGPPPPPPLRPPPLRPLLLPPSLPPAPSQTLQPTSTPPLHPGRRTRIRQLLGGVFSLPAEKNSNSSFFHCCTQRYGTADPDPHQMSRIPNTGCAVPDPFNKRAKNKRNPDFGSFFLLLDHFVSSKTEPSKFKTMFDD